MNEPFGAVGALFFIIVLVLFGVYFGHVIAHQTVAHECEKIGAFYVKDKVYECKVKEQR